MARCAEDAEGDVSCSETPAGVSGMLKPTGFGMRGPGVLCIPKTPWGFLRTTGRRHPQRLKRLASRAAAAGRRIISTGQGYLAHPDSPIAMGPRDHPAGPTKTLEAILGPQRPWAVGRQGICPCAPSNLRLLRPQKPPVSGAGLAESYRATPAGPPWPRSQNAR